MLTLMPPCEHGETLQWHDVVLLPISSRRNEAVAGPVSANVFPEAESIAAGFGSVVAMGSACFLVTLMFSLHIVALANGCSTTSQKRTCQDTVSFEVQPEQYAYGDGPM